MTDEEIKALLTDIEAAAETILHRTESEQG